MTTTVSHRLQDERFAAGLTLLISAIGLALANFAGNGENGGPAEYAIGLAAVAVVAAVLLGRVLPKVEDPAKTGWILAGLAVLSLVFFWSGLPFVLGIGAVYCGSRADRTGPAALGALAVVAAFVGCAIG